PRRPARASPTHLSVPGPDRCARSGLAVALSEYCLIRSDLWRANPRGAHLGCGPRAGGLDSVNRTRERWCVADQPKPSVSPLATAEPWDLVAAGYTAEALPYFEVFSRAALQAARLPSGARIVDVAAGPGTLSLLAAAAGARVSAIDLSEGMLAAF